MSEAYRGYELNEYRETPWYNREIAALKNIIDYAIEGRVSVYIMAGTEYDLDLTPDHRFIVGTVGLGGRTVHLPVADGSGRRYTIKNYNTSMEFPMIVDAAKFGGFLDGVDNYELLFPDCITVVDVAAETWLIYSQYNGEAPT